MIREYRPQLKEFDLTYPQFLVMMSLWNEDTVFIKALSEETCFDSGTLTPVLKRLEGKGYIQRDKSVEDERARVIKLTEQGKALKQKTSHIFSNMQCKVMLTEQEQLAINTICKKISSSLQDK